MQFIDLAAQQKRIREKIEENIRNVLNHGQYILGPEVKTLEKRLAAYVGVKHAISCASGTDALLMALMTYDVGPGDAVFTTPFTFIATAEVISLLGATPVFVDINPKTFNMDPETLDAQISKTRSQNPKLTAKGIMAVDLFGLPAEYEAINAIARKHHLFVIEDAAQSLGAEAYGQKAGSLAHIGCTSFFPAKPLGCYGDGGAVFTDNDALAEKLASIRVHGKGADKYDNVRIGINGRIDTLQAAILLAKLDIFPEEVELRQRVARRYTEHLGSVPSLVCPWVPAHMKSVFAQYSVLARDKAHRADIQARFKAADVPTVVYYLKPLHLQTAFQYLGHKAGDFPISEDCSQRILSLPMHPYLENAQQIRIAEALVSNTTAQGIQ